jgi:DNA polymerase III subunit alpha
MRKKAGEVFDLLEKFANYGFNKSHAAAYAVVSYQTAWSERRTTRWNSWPRVMNCDIAPHRQAEQSIKREVDRLEIPVIAPCVNRSWPLSAWRMGRSFTRWAG